MAMDSRLSSSAANLCFSLQRSERHSCHGVLARVEGRFEISMPPRCENENSSSVNRKTDGYFRITTIDSQHS